MPLSAVPGKIFPIPLALLFTPKPFTSMELQTFSVNWKKWQEDVSWCDWYLGGTMFFYFFLFLGPKPLSIYSLSPLSFSSSSILSPSLSPKTLQEGNFQVFLFIFPLGWVRQPWPLLSGATQGMLQTLHLPVCLPQGWEPCRCLGTTPHLC